MLRAFRAVPSLSELLTSRSACFPTRSSQPLLRLPPLRSTRSASNIDLSGLLSAARDSPAPPPRPRRPFTLRPRDPSAASRSPSALHLGYYLTERRTLDHLGSVASPSSSSKRDRPRRAATADEVRGAETRFAAVHAAMRTELGLVKVRASQEGSWRTEVDTAEETLGRVLGGSWLGKTDGLVHPEQLLRGLVAKGALSSFDSAFDELLRAVRLTLELHAAEADMDGTAMDPTARTLRTALEDYFALVDSPSAQDEYLLASKRRIKIRVPDGSDVLATPEQEAILASTTLEPGLTRIRAHAGTGKTTALLGLAQQRALRASATTTQLVVRSRRLRDALRAAFAREPHVEVNTLNALAVRAMYDNFGARFERKFLDPTTGRTRRLDHRTVRELLGIPQQKLRIRDTSSGREELLAGKRVAECVLKSYGEFLRSASPRPALPHLARPPSCSIVLPPRQHLSWVSELWRRVSNMDDEEAPMGFDEHVKLLQVSKGWRIEEEGPLLVDEAQDLTPAELELVSRERDVRRVVLVGDPLQAIDSFRGANTDWLALPAELELSLTRVRRFGPDVASVVNDRLKTTIYDGNLLVGNSKRRTEVYRESNVVEKTGRTIICPTYDNMYLELLRSVDSLGRFRLLTSVTHNPRDFFQLARTAWHLYRNKPFAHPHFALARFKTWRDFETELDSWGTDLPRGLEEPFAAWSRVERMASLRILGRDGLMRDLERIEQRLETSEQVPVDVQYTIAHQAKGLEYPHVVVSPSFPPPTDAFQTNLTHVALTRAMGSVEIPEGLLQVEQRFRGLHNFQLVPLPTSAISHRCSRCSQPTTGPLIAYTTPFPRHPGHMPRSPPSPLASGVGEFSAQARRAAHAYTSLSPAEDFPLCLDCADRSSYGPLRALVSFARGTPAMNDKDPSDGCDAAERFEGYIGLASERAMNRDEVLGEERNRETF
ncbi:hypothetical protein Rhopal_004064-T1 [Rhodotorula paludigena]|uniref:DNA helicase n=1 Tax=Rhodotorula paludigena TaxID=86838 RepID=A0AAV5GM94_9BASI|nr:hypothetical protein Rhopal_004064-T1 [Rhodotorula paludigena]